MSKVTQWLSTIFNDFLTVPRLCFCLSILFGAAVLMMMIINGNFSAMARTKKSDKKMKKFFKKNPSIDYFNILSFRKRCVAKLPTKVRKAWKAFECGGVPIQNTKFEMTLRDSVAKGGAIGFGIYLYYYIAVMAVLVVSMMFTNMPQELSSVYICVCLVIGAVGLFILGLQLYFLDKRADKRVDNMVTDIFSRIVVFKPAEKKQLPQSSQPDQTVKLTNIGTNPSFASLERVNLALTSVNEIHEARPLALASDRVESDAIDRLNIIINSILESGGSDELLHTIHQALVQVYEARFTRPIDDLRLKCIIKKLDKAM